RQRAQNTDGVTIQQARADIIADLLLGRTSLDGQTTGATRVQARIAVTIPISTLAGPGQQPPITIDAQTALSPAADHVPAPPPPTLPPAARWPPSASSPPPASPVQQRYQLPRSACSRPSRPPLPTPADRPDRQQPPGSHQYQLPGLPGPTRGHRLARRHLHFPDLQHTRGPLRPRPPHPLAQRPHQRRQPPLPVP